MRPWLLVVGCLVLFQQSGLVRPCIGVRSPSPVQSRCRCSWPIKQRVIAITWSLHQLQALRQRTLLFPVLCTAALMEATRSDCVRGVQALLQAGVPPDATDSDGWTALLSATLADHRGVIQELLKVHAVALA